MTPAVSFFVPGIPKPQGSKRGFVRGGKAVLVEAAGQAHKDWRATVALAAAESYVPMTGLLDGPLTLDVTFTMPKPKSRPKRRPMPDSAPDLDKLLRLVGDSLTGVVWRDDAQVVECHARKLYGERPGARITVTRYPVEVIA